MLFSAYSLGAVIFFKKISLALAHLTLRSGLSPYPEIEGEPAGSSGRALEGVASPFFYFSAFGNHIVMDGK